jgi:hypothetical protein
MNPTRDGRYEIHFRASPVSLDHAITNVETILGEGIGSSARRR